MFVSDSSTLGKTAVMGGPHAYPAWELGIIINVNVGPLAQQDAKPETALLS